MYYCILVRFLSSRRLVFPFSLVNRNYRLNRNISYEVPDKSSPEGTLHSLIVSEPVNIEALDQLVDIVELLLAEAD